MAHMHIKLLQSCLTLCNPRDREAWWASYSLWDSPGKNTGMGCHPLFQGIFPTQGSNLSLLHLLHWQAGSLQLAPWEALCWVDCVQNYGRLLAKKKKKALFSSLYLYLLAIQLGIPSNQDTEYWDFPSGLVVKTLPSNAGGVGSIPCWGAGIPHASQPKSQNIKKIL